MGFVNEPTRQRGQDWSAQLAQALQAAGKFDTLPRRPNVAEWIPHFNELSRQVPAARIQRVLDWYCKTLNQPMSVKAYSARTFCAKFDRIEEAMSEAQKSPARNIIITPIAQRAAERLSNDLVWPARVRAELPALVQISRDRVCDFGARIQREQAQLGEWDRDQRFLIRVREMHLSPNIAECDWLPLMHKKYCRRDYFGDVLALAFNAASQDFREFFWWEWVQLWSSLPNVKQYDDLLDRLVTPA